MIRVKCPKCQKALNVDDSRAGTVGVCPGCKAKFRLPAAAPAAKAPAAPKEPEAPFKVQESKPEDKNEAFDFTPYAVQQVEEKPKDDDDVVDRVARAAKAKKKREEAWEQVGVPAKWMKRFGMAGAILLIAFFMYTLINVFIQFHKERHPEEIASAARLEGKGGQASRGGPTNFYLPPFDDIARGVEPIVLFGIALGGLVVGLGLLGFVLMAAEKMKKLESYPIALIGCVLCIPIGLIGLLVLLRPEVKAEFYRSGTTAEVEKQIEQEKEEEEEEDEEEDEEDDEEDDE